MRWIFLVIVMLNLTGCARRASQEHVVERRFVHTYGVEVEGNDWRERGKNGQVITTLLTGENVIQNYQEGELHGLSQVTYPHSDKLQRSSHYKKGTLHKEVFHNTYGVPVRQIEHLPNHQECVTLWYEDGSPQAIEEIEGGVVVEGKYFDRNNQMESSVKEKFGRRVNRDVYGQHLSTDTIQNGEVCEQVVFYPNGTPKEQVSLYDGDAHGVKRTYLPSGEPLSEEKWENGKQHGLTTLYCRGEKIAEVPYVNGVREGIEKRFREGEEVVETISWVNGQRHGLSKTYIGNQTKRSWYFRGQLVSKSAYDSMLRPQN